MRFPNPQPGDYIEADWFASLYKALDEGPSVVPPLVITDSGAISLQDQPGFWVQFTGAPSGAKHPWKQVLAQPGGAWIDGVETGSTSLDSAYEINGNTADLTGLRSRAWRDRTSGEVRFQMSDCS